MRTVNDLISEKTTPGHIAVVTAAAMTEFSFIYQVRDEQLQYAPEQLAGILGYPQGRAESPEFTLFSLMPEDDAADVLADLQAAAAQLIPVPARTIHLRRNDGQWQEFKLQYYIRPIGANANGTAEWYVVVKAGSDDPAEQAELKELRRMRKETESILQYGTFDYDVTNDKGYWSDGLYSIFGYRQERPSVNMALLEKHVKNNLRREPMQKIGELNNPKNYTIEYQVTDTGGQRKILRVIGHILFDELGMPSRDVGLMIDVTNQRGQQATITKYIDDLKRSNRGLEEFAYVASHDLQEPLRKISTFSGRLAVRYCSLLDKEGNAYLERIIAAADSMRHLMENLLEFSRISTINQPTVPTNLNFILQQVRQELELRIDETGTDIIAGHMPVVEAVPSQIRQLFVNIINNAIKFAKPGVKPEIRISTSQASAEDIESLRLLPDHIYHKIVFQDNGIGFENEYAERIFQIFQRLHGKTEYPGSGIGLAICRKIAEGHHGTIFAHNVLNSGACFTLILPEKQP